ncbi:ATP-binding protein [Parabacteroides sp.]
MDMYRLNHEQLLKGVNLSFRRYLSRQVKWDRGIIGIFGAKGVGKTTLLLQHIKSTYGDSNEALYLPLDNIWFQERRMLSRVVKQFYEEGGRHLFLDNVHRYGNWAQAIERLHENYPDMQIVFAAPLLVEGEKEELSFGEKSDWYTLHTMSFREYLSYEGALDLKPVPLDELLLNHAEVTQQVMDEINIVPIFRNYLEHGCYPFYWEDPDAFNFRLQDLVRDSVDVDLPSIRPMNNAMSRKLKQLLIQLAKEAPEFPRMQALTSKYEMDNTQTHKLLDYVKEMGALRFLQVRKEDGGLARSYRSFLANTNLMASLFREMERIYLGETFFVDQMLNCGTVELLHNGDYCVNGKYMFVIGDPLMDYERIRNVENAFAAIHGQPKSVGNKIPIWALGLCY